MDCRLPDSSVTGGRWKSPEKVVGVGAVRPFAGASPALKPACWIPRSGRTLDSDARCEQGVSTLISKTFTVAELRICNAPALYQALGYFEAYLNGKRSAPAFWTIRGWTDYRKNGALPLLLMLPDCWKQGENVLAVELGEGWYGHRHEGAKKLGRLLPGLAGHCRGFYAQVTLDDTCFSIPGRWSWLCGTGAA